MESKPIVNSDLIGSFLSIELPGFAGKRKPEKCRVHYLEMGRGEPLLLVHSVGQSIYTWRAMMPILAQYYRVIAIDLPGFGHSDRPYSLSYSMDEMADVLLLIMDALHLPATHILGCTMGGMYALYAMTKMPIRFNKVIALTPSGISKNYPLRVRGLEGPFGFFFRESYGKKQFKKYLPLFYYDATIPNDTVVQQYFSTCDDFASRQAIMYAVRNFDEEPVLKAMESCDHEVLILWGEEDRLVPMDKLFEIKKTIPNGVYHSLRNVGHWMHEEKAEMLSEIVDRYIQYRGTNE
ncbi:MAG: alpha/beta hydrolase [Clostridia bacterium]|nr:alpha/beta hydrolase [Clostridia bacterium]MBQ9188965.1 alpha/beta hydrolase [Clostridia bacterium]MBR3270292.1 alpha/beta hydrolase [Clostridia bacterium]